MQTTKWIPAAGRWLIAALFGLAPLAACLWLADEERQWIFQPSKVSCGGGTSGIDYLGFGKSSSELPSERMAYDDAEAAWRCIERQHPEARRCIFGHSPGAAVAVKFATQESDAAGVIVEGGFTSSADVFGTFEWALHERYGL